MHEMSIVIRFVNLAEEAARKQNAEKITKITLEVGETSGVLPFYLQRFYPEATKGTMLEGSTLETIPLPVQAVCQDCGQTYHPDKEHDYKCPSCQSINAKITGGREVRLRDIEVQ